jgi:hypothetical protein
MHEKNFTSLTKKTPGEEVKQKEIEEYFRKQGTDLEAGIKRIKEMVERHKRESGIHQAEEQHISLAKEKKADKNSKA